jgi:cold shock protein
MQTGTIKWFNPEKGYGFIRPDDGGEDIFLHISAVEEAGLDMLEPGQKIRFTLEQNPKNGKKSAVDLQLV